MNSQYGIRAERFPVAWVERCGKAPVDQPEALREWIAANIRAEGGVFTRRYEDASGMQRRVAATLERPATSAPVAQPLGKTPTKITGIVCPFGERTVIGNAFSEEYMPGCVDEQARQGWTRDGYSVLGMWAHDHAQPLASTASGTLTLKVTRAGVEYTMVPVPQGIGAYVLELVSRGDCNGSSAGFRVREERWSLPDGEDGLPHCELLAIELREASVTPWPAYRTASAEARAELTPAERSELNGQRQREFEARANELSAPKVAGLRVRHNLLGKRWGSGPKDGPK